MATSQAQLEINLVGHPQIRAVNCCLCLAEWKEFFLQVAMHDAAAGVGSLCPACLQRSPVLIAERLTEYAELLANHFSSPPRGHALPLVRGPRCRTEESVPLSRSMVDTSTTLRQLRLHHSGSRWGQALEEAMWLVPSGESATVAKAGRPPCALSERDVADLRSFSVRLKSLERWSITLGDAIEAERRCFSEQGIDLPERDLHRWIDDRYYTFLSRGA